MSQFVMPSLGADMEDGILVEHLTEPGDPIKRGDIIAAVETQKGVIEIEAFEDGFLDKWLVPLGTTVPVGTPIAIIRNSDVPDPREEPELPHPADPSPEPRPQEVPQPVDLPPEPAIPENPQPTPEPPPHRPDEFAATDRQRVTPAARRRAAKTGVDLSRLADGKQKIISLRDLAATEPSPEPSNASAPLTAMRQAISAAMTRSKREIPHYYLADTLDLTIAEEFVAARNADLPPGARLVLGVLYIRAVALAAQSVPEFNGFFDQDQFTPSPDLHVGMAIKLRGGGLVAPALHNADAGNLDALMARLRDLVARVRQGRFRARELSDPTITLTSLGERGVSQITGVIYPPQVAIVGIGTPQLRPIIVDGQVVARKTATITLSADHRVSDGHRGARFLRAIIAHLQKPEAL